MRLLLSKMITYISFSLERNTSDSTMERIADDQDDRNKHVIKTFQAFKGTMYKYYGVCKGINSLNESNLLKFTATDGMSERGNRMFPERVGSMLAIIEKVYTTQDQCRH